MRHVLSRSLVICLGFFFMLPSYGEAYVPVMIEQDSLKDITVVYDPELAQSFYGSLQGFPHTYELRLTEPLHLRTQILLPDVAWSKNNVSGIIIREEKKGRVKEVARLKAQDASWETWREPLGGDMYRKGAQFETNLDPGVYRIEVHTPDNLEKYVLTIGTREEMTLSYFEHLGRIREIKQFFEKSGIHIFESPLVHVPVLVLVVGSGVLWYWIHRKRHKQDISDQVLANSDKSPE